MRHDLRLTAWAALLVLPVLAAAAWGVTHVPWPPLARTALLALLGIWCAFALVRLRASVLGPLRTTAGLLQGLREGNYSARARGEAGDDGLGQVLTEVNALAEWLQRQRLTEVEASALLTTVMAELDAAVLAFDGRQALALANPAAARLFGRPVSDLLGTVRRGARLRGTARRPADPIGQPRLPQCVGTLGGPALVIPSGRACASPRRAQRRQPHAARGRARRLAAAHSCAQPRAQQLAHADHLDRQQPRAVTSIADRSTMACVPTCARASA